MAMVCPQCAGTYDQRLQCPTCGVRLLYDFRGQKPKTSAPAVRWQQTSWGRIMIGLVLAQGLYFGLEHLLLGLLEFLNNQGLIKWTMNSVAGLVFLQIVQVFTLTIGAVLAGGGQQRGVLLGGLVGVWNGVLSVLLDPVLHPNFVPTLTALSLIGVPLVHIVFGTFGGWIGYSIWRPVQPDAPAHPTKPTRKHGVAPLRKPMLTGRVAWFRVLLGAVVAAAGYLTAAAIFNFLIDFSAGRLTSDGFWQDRVVTWEIQALAVFIGGGVAGYNTSSGLKQGLCVGLLNAICLMAIFFNFRRAAPEIAALTVGACFCLCAIGGWFSGQLFPPVVAPRSRRWSAAPMA
jgi:DNA-directed RNA polymerase subunit RPC12/RpoP